MDRATMRERLAGARVARLGTVDAGGGPHVVPCCFALLADTVYSAVDHKPKRHGRLRRLANLAGDPRAELVVDHYDDADWDALWWVRLRGRGRLVEDADERRRAIEALAAKYPQYRARPPVGAVMALEVDEWRAWEAAGPG